MESLVTSVRNNLNNESLETTIQSSSSSSHSKDPHDFRRIQMPETKIGLGSTEGDMIVMLKKYLEIVGLVFFVWLLGEYE
jgi:hypothetical protein